MTSYHHNNPTRFTHAECEAAVGERVTLVLTGTIVEARVSEKGSFVMFAADERWGFEHKLGFDLDAFKRPGAPR